MIRVQAASRLHFGLFNPCSDEQQQDDRGSQLERRFGGVGLMVAEPGLSVRVEPAAAWSAEGPLAERALALAHRFVERLQQPALPPQHIVMEEVSPEHAGLGTGTQLAMTVARALAVLAGLERLTAGDLGRAMGRGQRSGIGLHGFERGGFLVDGGKGLTNGIAPVIARLDFPEPWRVLLVCPISPQGLHGPAERKAFAQLQLGDSIRRTELLCRLVLLGMLPALAERDFGPFGDALYEFNVRAGEPFEPFQCGVYRDPRVAETVDFLRRIGFHGVGQSSWGPTVFGVAADEEHACFGRRRVQQFIGGKAAMLLITRGCNSGAIVETH